MKVQLDDLTFSAEHLKTTTDINNYSHFLNSVTYKTHLEIQSLVKNKQEIVDLKKKIMFLNCKHLILFETVSANKGDILEQHHVEN